MKKIIALLSLLTIMALAACGQNKAPTAAELLALGENYLLELNYEQANAAFIKLIEIEPKNERAYTGAAEAYIGLGDMEKAIAMLRQGLEQTPDSAAMTDKLNALLPGTESVQAVPSPETAPKQDPPAPDPAPETPEAPATDPAAPAETPAKTPETPAPATETAAAIVEDLSPALTKYAAQTVNLRDRPGTKGTAVIGSLKTNDEVVVNGKTADGWYRVSTVNGAATAAFVSGKYLQDTKAEAKTPAAVAQAPTEQPKASATDTAAAAPATGKAINSLGTVIISEEARATSGVMEAFNAKHPDGPIADQKAFLSDVYASLSGPVTRYEYAVLIWFGWDSSGDLVGSEDRSYLNDRFFFVTLLLNNSNWAGHFSAGKDDKRLFKEDIERWTAEGFTATPLHR